MKNKIIKGKNTASIVATAISITLLVAGTVGLILLQKPLREESLDVRKDASVDNGQVTISTSPASGSTLDLSSSTINIQANTSGVQTDGVQLVFNIIGNLSNTPTVSIVDSSGLSEIKAEIENATNGYLVSLIGFPDPIGSTFSSNSPVTIAQLVMEPSAEGNIELSFDRELSKSIIHGSNDAEDALTHVDAISFIAVDSSAASPSPTPSPTPTPSATPTVSPSPTPGTGGVSVQGCNDSCDSNAECETNHRCYNGRCRLVTNVSSETCEDYDPGDQGLSFGCNEYCADSDECDDQYTCLENKCRRSDNPDDSSCQIPSSTIKTGIINGCNLDCTANKDCAANLRCYYGECRLATNVSSSSCSSPTTPTVSNLYKKDAPTTTPKGGDLADQQDDEDDGAMAPIATIKPTAAPSTYNSDNNQKPAEEETALDAMISKLQEAGIPINLLPIIALAIGGLLLLVTVIPKLFGKKDKYGTAKMATRQKKSQEDQQYEQKLQAKLAQIKKQSTTQTPVRTPANKPISPVNKPISPTNQSTPTPQPAAPQKSTMMERVKEKGINQPNN